MATQLAREKSAQAWCKPATSDKIFDVELAEAFADILDEVLSDLAPSQTQSLDGGV